MMGCMEMGAAHPKVEGVGLLDTSCVSLFTLFEEIETSLHGLGLTTSGRDRVGSGKREEEGVDIPRDRAAIAHRSTLCFTSTIDVLRGQGDIHTRRSERVALQPDISVVC